MCYIVHRCLCRETIGNSDHVCCSDREINRWTEAYIVGIAISAGEKDVNRYIKETETRAPPTSTCFSYSCLYCSCETMEDGTTASQLWELKGVSVAAYSEAIHCNCHKLLHPTPGFTDWGVSFIR